jgi:hypothetical protein
LAVAQPKAEVLLVSDLGMGKRTPVKEYPTQGRHGVGVVAGSLAGKQRLVGMFVGEPDDRLTAVTSKGGGKAMKFDAAGRRGRAARGSTVLKLKDNETIQRLVPMQPQFSLPPEPEPAPAPAKVKGNGNGRHAPEVKTRAAGKKGSTAKAKPAAKNGKRK